MIGMLERGEVEFALGPFTITPQRETVCNFLLPVHNDNKAILTVRPGLTNDLSGFLKPFTVEVWFLILLSFIVIGFAMTLIVISEANIFGHSSENLVLRSTQWVFSTFAQESSDWIPKKNAARIVMTTWLFATLIFMSSYSGILTAMLTLPRVTIPIDSLEDLVAQTKLPWRLEKGSMATQYLMESTDPVRREVVARSSGFFYDCWKSKEDIAAGKFAGVCDETTMKKAMSWDFSSTGQCHLYMTREKVLSGAMMGIAFQINSSYFEGANNVIHRVKQGGLVGKWLKDQITNTTECLKPPSSDRRDGIKALDLNVFAGPLIFVVGGEIVLFLFNGLHCSRLTNMQDCKIHNAYF
ncbi:glutamate receptor ionotropic, kainate glr-3-like [Palaemon carinicauda]|uniref:glutamate receptor ionotropic, kainate glr-3-like n=1 Tax=Palaemon carinicauda TaxID=392227 RepID=UPI0035B6540C